MLRQPVAQLVDAILYEQRLQACDGGLGEEGFPGLVPHAVLVVVQGVETRMVVLPERPHGPISLAALALVRPHVRLFVKVRVVDVYLVRIYHHSWTFFSTSPAHAQSLAPLAPSFPPFLFHRSPKFCTTQSTHHISHGTPQSSTCTCPPHTTSYQNSFQNVNAARRGPGNFAMGEKVEAIQGAVYYCIEGYASKDEGDEGG